MSYDIRFNVKIEGLGKYIEVGSPEKDSPTYNVRTIFAKCMDWDYSQGDWDEDGQYQKCYYPCDFVIERIEHGLKELSKNFESYRQYEPENKWGTVETVHECLLNWHTEIYDFSRWNEIPLEHIYFSW